jgi:uncharacterized protein
MKSTRSRIRRWLLAPFAAYLGLAALVAGCQRKLIYHPPRLTAEQLRPYQERHRLQPWTNTAGLRIGWRRPTRTAEPKAGAWLVLHGNAGSAAGREYIFDPIQEAVDAEVFVLEYPGYADRPGKPSQESLVAASLEGLDLIPGREKVTVVGESLGTGVASALAGSRPDRIRGVLLLVPFRELAEAAASHYPWLPVRLLLRDRFPSSEWLTGYHGPLAVVVAGADEVIPPESGRRLFRSYPGPKRLWEFPGENHWEGSNRDAAFYREFWNWMTTPG